MDKKKICFVIGPIGTEGSENRTHADWLLDGIIRPVFSDCHPDFEVTRADIISSPGMIDTQIIGMLLDASLVIADMTFLNANAFYELGIRHMAQKPVVHMFLQGTQIPFDVALYRAIPFERTRFSDVESAKSKLKASLSEILSDSYKVDNPIIRAKGVINIEKNATSNEKIMLDQIASISKRLDEIDTKGAAYSAANTSGLNRAMLRIKSGDFKASDAAEVKRIAREVGGDTEYDGSDLMVTLPVTFSVREMDRCAMRILSLTDIGRLTKE